MSGVARLTGRNNTFFRTDARSLQPDGDGRRRDRATSIAVGPSNPTPQSATLTVPAGRIRRGRRRSRFDPGRAGGLRRRRPLHRGPADRDPLPDEQRGSAGVQPGTFGAQQCPVPLRTCTFLRRMRARSSPQSARTPRSGPTSDSRPARTARRYGLTLKSARSVDCRCDRVSLGAFGWAQPSIATSFRERRFRRTRRCSSLLRRGRSTSTTRRSTTRRVTSSSRRSPRFRPRSLPPRRSAPRAGVSVRRTAG